MLGGVLAFLGGCALVFLMFRSIQNNPAMFSRENLSKSFTTMGILALLLIGFIGVMVLFLRHS